MRSLNLYITEQCQLCDEAFTLLADMPELAGLRLTLIDIAKPGAVQERLIHAIGPNIPLLSWYAPDALLQQLDRADANAYLPARFNAADVQRWLRRSAPAAELH